MRFAVPTIFRALAALLFAASLCFSQPTRAEPLPEDASPKTKELPKEQVLNGTAMVQDAGSLMLAGKRIYLWGIETLANDQKCWLRETAWSCGEEAALALKHFAESVPLRCVVKEILENKAAKAQCFRVRGDKEIDLGHYMVAQGWALDAPSVSAGLYTKDEEKARVNQNGIWSSRFQTPTDWQEGIQKFLNDDDDGA